MKNKIYNILLITALTFSLSACGIEQGTVEQIKWDELGNLEDVPELRESWNETLGVTGTTGNYDGLPFYTPDGKVDNNNTLDVGLHNRELEGYFYSYGADTYELVDGAKKSYTDLDEEDDDTVIAMGINGYYDIVPDNEPGYSNPYQTLTREQAMSGAMRATTPVDPTLTVNPDYEKAVGKSEYNLYAQSLDETSYLSTSDGSLNENTAHSTITLGEVVYMLVNTYYQDEMQNVKISDDGKSATFTYTDDYGIEQTETIEFDDTISGGDIATSHKFNSKSQTLKYMLENPDDGVDEQMYKAFVVAYHYHLIDTETRWDEGITKSEYIQMLTLSLVQQTKTMDHFSIKSIGNSSDTSESTGTQEYTLLIDPDRPGAVALGDLPNNPRPSNNEDRVKELQATQKAWEQYNNEMTSEQIKERRDAARAAGATGYDVFYWIMPAGSMGDTTGYSYEYNPYTGEKYYPGDWVPGTGTYWHGTASEMEIAWDKAIANGYHESQAK